jgi:hypothetical protein
MVITSEISAMQLVTRRVPKSMHRVHSINSMMQKRNFGEGGVILAMVLGYYGGQAVAGIGCVVIGGVCEGSSMACKAIKYTINPKACTANVLYEQVAVIGSERCSKAYITKEKCENPRCCKYVDQQNIPQKRDEFFYDINQEIYFLYTLKDGLHKLHNKEKEASLLFTQHKIDAQGYEKVMGLLEHKKDCYLKQLALFDGWEHSYYKDVKDFITQLHTKE